MRKRKIFVLTLASFLKTCYNKGMATKYPIVLAHGIILKDGKFFKAFGRIEKVLRAGGHSVQTSTTDGVGSIETNAEQLKKQIEEILQTEGVEKVNVIAHSKGGLDTRYMIEKLGMKDKIASVTFLCTPHKGSQIATKLYALPRPVKGFLAFWINLWYRIFGDKHPDILKACRQLSANPSGVLEGFEPADGIFMQSYSTTLEKSSDDFIMGIPLLFSRKFENDRSDGVVSVESSKFATYLGNCIDDSISHTEIVDLTVDKKKKEKIYAFYTELCKDLEKRGY